LTLHVVFGMYLMQACVHKVVAKLKEKDPPTEWTFEQDHR